MNTYELTTTTYIHEVTVQNWVMTVTAKSSDSTRKLEISTDGGIEYFLPELDLITDTQLVCVVASPITHIKMTGIPTDKLILVT